MVSEGCLKLKNDRKVVHTKNINRRRVEFELLMEFEP